MRTAYLFAAAAGLGLAQATFAQNALGDGTGLDANLSRSGTRNTAVRDFAAEKRFRDAIVTGNAPAGLSFRGDAGYTAPGDLRVPVASDALYQFRRDSLYSGLSGMGIRGTEAVQRQMGLTTGNSIPRALGGSLTVSRDYAVPAPGVETVERLDPGEAWGQGSGSAGGELSTLRSTAAYNSVRSMEPALLDVRVRKNGQLVGFMASGLRGVYTMDFGSRQDTAMPSTSAGPAPEEETGLPDAMSERFQTWAGRQPEQEAEQSPAWRRRLDELKATLEQERLEEEEAAAEAPKPAPEKPTMLVPEPVNLDGDTVRMLREAPGRVSLTGPAGPTAEPFDDAMRAAQAHLASGRYFDAEERFTAALAARPGDPVAAAGRVHAQIGAGLYRSAALNLRELLTTTPAFIGARYEPEGLPAKERLDKTAALAREYARRPAGTTGEGVGMACLLAAYVGYQTDDDALTAWALEHWSGLPGAASDTLLRVLRQVWALPLGEAAPK